MLIIYLIGCLLAYLYHATQVLQPSLRQVLGWPYDLVMWVIESIHDR